jgi:uncharacterized membrane protein YoaK (UPF0700 family)
MMAGFYLKGGNLNVTLDMLHCTFCCPDSNMPVSFLRRLTGRARTRSANRQLGAFLAFVAGAVNAGGFLAIRQYTSHMTGIVSSIADDLVLGNIALAAAGVSALMAFLLGAATTAILINWARHRKMHSEYALSLALEALLLMLFGLLGANLESYVPVTVPATVLLLCYIMGLQNAIVTKISKAEIRTTHVTGLTTDLGIELGKLMYWNRSHAAGSDSFVAANRDKLAIHGLILGMFFIGGALGAFGFKHAGFIATLPLALILLALALIPILDDALQLRHAR